MREVGHTFPGVGNVGVGRHDVSVSVSVSRGECKTSVGGSRNLQAKEPSLYIREWGPFHFRHWRVTVSNGAISSFLIGGSGSDMTYEAGRHHGHKYFKCSKTMFCCNRLGIITSYERLELQVQRSCTIEINVANDIKRILYRRSISGNRQALVARTIQEPGIRDRYRHIIRAETIQ